MKYIVVIMILLIVVVWFPYVMLLIGVISALIIGTLTTMVVGFITIANIDGIKGVIKRLIK
jgi:hypothetical protein